MAHEKDIVHRHPKDPSALLDIIRDVQEHFDHVPEESVSAIDSRNNILQRKVR